MDNYGSYVRQATISMLSNLDTDKLVQIARGLGNDVPKSEYQEYLQALESEKQHEKGEEILYAQMGAEQLGHVEQKPLDNHPGMTYYTKEHSLRDSAPSPGVEGERMRGSEKGPMIIPKGPGMNLKIPKLEPVQPKGTSVREMMQNVGKQPDAPSDAGNVGGAFGYP